MSRVTIEYCVVCNYYPRAARLAEELETKLGLRSDLIKGSGGVFEVTFEGELLFSKKKLGRFPEPGEVAGLVEARLAARSPGGS